MIFLLIEAPEDRLMAYQHIKRSSFVTRPGDKLFGARAVAERLGIDLRSSVGAEIPLWIRFWPGLALRSTLDRFARRLVIHAQSRSTPDEALELGRVPGFATEQDDPRHPLRDQMVEAQHAVDRRPDRRSPCRRRA